VGRGKIAVSGEFRSVRLERDGPVATVAIDRPEARNSVTKAVALEIFDAVSMVSARAQKRPPKFTGR
jgi:enoyl-CoA hydratase/carnithine racemase